MSKGVATEPRKAWDGAAVRTWLESRVQAARADQIMAERYGREQQDACDKAAAEEMVCAALGRSETDLQAGFSEALKSLLARDEYVWRGVYNDDRFDRHVRSYIRKLVKMAKTNEGFENTTRYQ